jgi:hypothetical protein
MPKGRSDEAKVSNAIQLDLGARSDCRIMRNNVGGTRDATGRFIAYGLGSHGGHVLKGPSDLIGWRTITITPDMVGQQVAVFAAIEVKDQGKATPEQLNFIAQVQAAGGFAGVAHNPDEARAILHL